MNQINCIYGCWTTVLYMYSILKLSEEAKIKFLFF